MAGHDPNIRFDPVWRRIKSDRYTRQLEGAFPDRFLRLDSLNNWGALAWLYPHATASKQAHHLGGERNAVEFLRLDATREKYEASLRVATHVMHWGHPPLSYSGAEAILRAASVRPSVQTMVDDLVDEVVKKGSLSCDTAGHEEQCAPAMKAGDRPFELYRWISAWLVSKSWAQIWRAVKKIPSASGRDSKEVREAVIRTLVCREDEGYGILGRCNLADYVPRDLLQCGTAWLTVDLEALWEANPLSRVGAAKEWALLEAANEYLDDRYYATPRALLVHSLCARVLAQGLMSKGLGRSRLEELLNKPEGDDSYQRVLPDYHRTRLNDIHDLAIRGRLDQEWSLVGSFESVSVSGHSRLEAEDVFSGRTGTGRLSYPLTAGFSVVVDPGSWGLESTPLAGDDRKYATIHLHAKRSPTAPVDARQTLSVAADILEWQGPFGGARSLDQVLSWILQGRVEQRSGPVIRSGASLLSGSEQARSSVIGIRALTSTRSIIDHRLVRVILDSMSRGSALRATQFAEFVLRMPWNAARRKDGRKLLETTRSLALDHIQGGGSDPGAALELAVAVDELLSNDETERRIIAVGATALEEGGRMEAEWDVIRIDFTPDGRWKVRATECALNRNQSKDSEDRDKLEILRARLQGVYPDLSTFDAQLATISSDTLDYKDAGRGFSQ